MSDHERKPQDPWTMIGQVARAAQEVGIDLEVALRFMAALSIITSAAE